MKQYTLLFLLLLIAMPSFAKTKSIDQLDKLEINNSSQWLLYRGKNIDKPLVLFIHGGPASPLMLFSRGFDNAFIKDFLVVHWDQRQSGKSYDPTQPIDTFSAQQVAKDGLAVVEHLKKKFGKSKILLVGHSWGSIIGALMVKNAPDNFNAYISVGTVADMAKGDAQKYLYLNNEITDKGDATDKADLKKLDPPPWKNFGQITLLSRLMMKYKGSFYNLTSKQLNATVEKSKDYSAAEMKNLNVSMEKIWHLIGPFLFNYKAEDTLKQIDIPIYFAQGSHDMATPTAVAKEYFDRLAAPKGKHWVEFHNSAHFPMYEEPQEFLLLMRRAVK